MRGYKNFDSDPHPGDLRHMIEIGYTENQINENGYPEPTDVVVCRVWAAVTDAGNQHYRSADVMNTEAVINFTIRYREDIKPGMWVRFQGDKWNISTLGEYSFKRTYLGLKASIAKHPGLRRRLAGHFAQPESARAVLRLFHDHHGSQPS